jgi:hypothetical protein
MMSVAETPSDPSPIRNPKFEIRNSKFNPPLLIALATFAALRAPLLTREALPLGWNSDAGIFGLMAKAIFERRAFPIYFFGQSYMGPLTSWTAVLVALFTRHVTPFELRLGVALMNAAALVFYWLALRRSFAPRAVAWTMLWLAIGPDDMMRFVIAPVGAEQLFFLSAVLCWYATKFLFSSAALPRHWFVFGLLSGFGWWIHQGCVFIIAPVLVVAIGRTEWWARVGSDLRLSQRITLEAYHFGAPVRVAINVLQLLLAADAILGALLELGAGVPAFFLFDPIAEPLACLAVLHLAFFLVERARTADVFDFRRANALLFAAGALLGYAPVILGRFLHAYPDRYSADAGPVPLPEFLRHARAVLPDLVPFAGNVVVALIVLPMFALALRRFRNDRGLRAMALLATALAFVFYFVSSRTHEGQVRYVLAVLPFVYVFAAEELLRLRVAGAVLCAAVVVALAVPRWQQVMSVRRGEYESYARWLPNTDPRRVLATIRSEGYRVCYADYWVADKLEWLANGDVHFITHPGYDRRTADTRRLTVLNVPKCFVEPNGRVRPVRPDDLESAIGRKAREHLRRNGDGWLAAPELR